MKKNFIVVKSYFDSIDNGVFFSKPIEWIYWLIALSNLALPAYLLYDAIDSFWRWDKQWTMFLIELVVLIFVSIISFLIWIGRKSSLIKLVKNNKETPATFVFAHFIKTVGEWLGLWIGVMGFFDAFLDSVFYGRGCRTLFYELDIILFERGITTSIVSILLFPVIGYFMVLITKFISEQMTYLAIIANNSKINK